MVFRPDSPIDLPGGRLGCGAHGLEVCPRCCVDYTFMDEVLSDYHEISGSELSSEGDYAEAPDSNNHSRMPYSAGDGDIALPGGIISDYDCQDLRVGTGRVIFEKFIPPNYTDLPSSLFPPRITTRATPPTVRFTNSTDPTQMLVYTDGACLNNGQRHPRAGCAFIFRPPDPHKISYCSFRLENKGPTGIEYTQTSNRAELRAVIGALRFRVWNGEGFKSVVIATDSTYVVDGATDWVRGWLRKGWVKGDGKPVKNKDLWEALLGEAERWSERGVTIRFWHIPRALNTIADERAKEVATEHEVDRFADRLGLLV